MPRAGLSDAQLVQRLLGATQQRLDVRASPTESRPPQGHPPSVVDANTATHSSNNLPRPTPSSNAASSTTATSPSSVHIAVQGCVHGELDKIYDACLEHEQQTGRKIDLLICCGDFQSIRNAYDLNCMAVPQKYRTYGDFVQYFQGAKAAPFLTIFIGGNHEASNVLAEQYYGGFVAENIFYLGHSGVIEVCGLRIAGLSGIYHARDYTRPYTKLPLPQQAIRDAYHVRKVEIEKLKRFAALSDQRRSRNGDDGGAVDLMISHDWPTKITSYGDEDGLLARKPYFRDDIAHAALGNPHTMELLHVMRPRYWFAAHLHVYFTAQVPHRGGRGTQTNFIALDKCVHHSRQCLTFLDVPLRVPPPPAPQQKPQLSSLDHDAAAAALVAVPPFSRTIHMDSLWAEVIRESNDVVRHQQDRMVSDSAFTDLLSPPYQTASSSQGGGSSFPFRDTMQVIQKLGLSGHPLMVSPSVPRVALGEHSSGSGGSATASSFTPLTIRVGTSLIPALWPTTPVPAFVEPQLSSAAVPPAVAKEAGNPTGTGEGFDWVEDTVAR